MKLADVTCPHCRAGFQRVELSSMSGTKSEYRCPVCDTVLELLDGNTLVAYRLTVQPTTVRTSKA
nr:MJ0042-type zinc finger domain-containing protein [Bradyrhizobium tropiciagri]